MALSPRESSIRRPWDLSPWEGDVEAYREDLYAGMAFGMPDMRAFAREGLKELLRDGYYGMEERTSRSTISRKLLSSRRPRSRPS